MCRLGTGTSDKDAGYGRLERKHDCVDGGQVGETKMQDTAGRKGCMIGQMGQVEVTGRRGGICHEVYARQYLFDKK